MGLLLVTPWGSRIVSCPLEALHSFYSLTLVLICSPVFRAIQIIPTRLLVNTSPTTQLRTIAERLWLSFLFPVGFRLLVGLYAILTFTPPRLSVSEFSNFCKRIYRSYELNLPKRAKKRTLSNGQTSFLHLPPSTQTKPIKTKKT